MHIVTFFKSQSSSSRNVEEELNFVINVNLKNVLFHIHINLLIRCIFIIRESILI